MTFCHPNRFRLKYISYHTQNGCHPLFPFQWTFVAVSHIGINNLRTEQFTVNVRKPNAPFEKPNTKMFRYRMFGFRTFGPWKFGWNGSDFRHCLKYERFSLVFRRSLWPKPNVWNRNCLTMEPNLKTLKSERLNLGHSLYVSWCKIYLIFIPKGWPRKKWISKNPFCVCRTGAKFSKTDKEL